MGLRRIAALGVAAVMAVTGLSAWWGLYRTSRAAPEQAFAVASRWQPFGGPAWLPAAGAPLARLAPAERMESLARLARYLPLSHVPWLGMAEAKAALGAGAEEIAPLLETAAAVRPGDPELHWKAAMVALQAGASGLAMERLRVFVSLRPREVDRAVLVARRWLTEPDRLVARVAGDQAEALAVLLERAARWRDWPLAEAAWRRLPQPLRAQAGATEPYVTQLVLAGRGREAAVVWRAAAPGFGAERIYNGGFDRPLEQRTPFEWRVRAPQGATIARSEQTWASPPAALHLHFHGTHNLRLAVPEQFIAVEPGATYRLRGRWRAEGITTRSLPHWLVLTHDGRRGTLLAQIQAPGLGGWAWQEFHARFTVPESVDLIRLRLRRLPTDNLDRKIGGDLYIDDLALERLSE